MRCRRGSRVATVRGMKHHHAFASTLTLFVTVALAATPAEAGYRAQAHPVEITDYVAGSGRADGALLDVRGSDDSVQYIGCIAYGATQYAVLTNWWTGGGGGSWVVVGSIASGTWIAPTNWNDYVRCYVSDSTGRTRQCYSNNPSIVRRAESITRNSEVWVTWSANGTCVDLLVNNGSNVGAINGESETLTW